MLAGDLHQRYAVSASAFENDVRLFLQGRPTVADLPERRVTRKSDPTVGRSSKVLLPQGACE